MSSRKIFKCKPYPKIAGLFRRPLPNFPLLQLSDYQLFAWWVQEVTSKSEKQNEQPLCFYYYLAGKHDGGQCLCFSSVWLHDWRQGGACVPLLTLARDRQSDALRWGMKAHRPGRSHTAPYPTVSKTKLPCADTQILRIIQMWTWKRREFKNSLHRLFARGRTWAKRHTSPHPQTHTHTPFKY